MGDYDAATQKILEQIDQVQSEIDSLNEKASEEILKASFRIIFLIFLMVYFYSEVTCKS